MTKRTRNEDGKLPNDKILEIIKDVQNYTGPLKSKKEHFEKMYPEFVENYAFLFDLACQPNFDFARLKYMLDLKQKIDQNKVSFEAASREVGQKMFDVYVKDKLDGDL